MSMAATPDDIDSARTTDSGYISGKIHGLRLGDCAASGTMRQEEAEAFAKFAADLTVDVSDVFPSDVDEFVTNLAAYLYGMLDGNDIATTIVKSEAGFVVSVARRSRVESERLKIVVKLQVLL